MPTAVLKSEEERQFDRGRLRRVRPVNAVALDIGGEQLADGALGGIGRIGGAHDFAQSLDGVLALQRHDDDRPLGHELHQAAEEGPLPVHGVETLCLRFG